MTHRQWLTSFIKTHTHTYTQTHALSLSLSLFLPPLSLFPPPLPAACLPLRNFFFFKCSVVVFFSLSPSLSLLYHFLPSCPRSLSPALPPSHPATCANQSQSTSFLSPPSPNLFPPLPPSITADVLKSPLFSLVSAHLAVTMYLFQSPLSLPLSLSLSLPLSLFSVHAVCPKCYFIYGWALLAYTRHIPCIIANTHGKHLFYSPIFLSLLFSPLAPFFFFVSEPLLRQQPVISTAPPPTSSLFLFFSLLLSLSRVKERVRSERGIGAGERCCPDQKGPLKSVA